MLDTAYYASLLFTVHPVHTEPVAGLVGRADVLNSVLFFVVILLYQKVRNAKGESVVMWYIIKITVIGCAVLCKETAISVVVTCLHGIHVKFNRTYLFVGRANYLRYISRKKEKSVVVRSIKFLVFGEICNDYYTRNSDYVLSF